MKENSIEEDIERLKLCSTNQCHICGRYEKEECMLERNRCEQHILSDYKRALKENKELKDFKKQVTDIESTNFIKYKNYISIQKVKDKIEELNQYYKKEIYPSLYQWCDITITEHYDEMVELLQEIIGDK